jgi:tetratricopeptide (TPR) repeat protein
MIYLDNALMVLEKAAAIQRACTKQALSYRYYIALGELHEKKCDPEGAIMAYQNALEVIDVGSE